jgi:hypothetical protein
MSAALLLRKPLTGRATCEKIQSPLEASLKEQVLSCKNLGPRMQAATGQVAPVGLNGALAGIERCQNLEPCSLETKRYPSRTAKRIDACISPLHYTDFIGQ